MRRPPKILHIVLAGILAVGIIFFRDSAPVRVLRTGTVVLLRPLMGASVYIGRRLGAFTSGLPGEAIQELISENERLRAKEFYEEKLREENQSLQKVLGFKEAMQARLTGARVLLYTNESGRESLLVDQGADAGIKKGDIAIDDNQVLVGEVSETADRFSTVSIASNPAMRFPVTIIPTGAGALARGIGARTIALDLIPNETPIRRGDFVARSLSNITGRLHTVLVGMVADEYAVSSGAFVNARATLLARPELLDRVFVVSLIK